MHVWRRSADRGLAADTAVGHVIFATGLAANDQGYLAETSGTRRRLLAGAFVRSTAYANYTISRSVLVELALRSLARATISSWRTRSREMPSSLPTSKSVRLRPSPMP